MTNVEIAKVFIELADLLEMKGESQFKVRAYRQAAHAFKQLPKEVEALVRDGYDLEEIPGVGEAIAKKTVELVSTGHLSIHDKLKAEFPDGILDILTVPGIGPRMAMRLYTELGVGSIEDLERAIRDGRVAKMPRMGGKAAQRLMSQLKSARARERAC